MAQVVSANELLQELNKNGFVALYINFDTGKADLSRTASQRSKRSRRC